MSTLYAMLATGAQLAGRAASEEIQLLPAIAIAGAGGFMLNFMNLWEDSKKLKSERVLKDGWYWTFFATWPLIGAGLAGLYILDGSALKPLLAFSLGATAPTTIQSLMTVAARPSRPPPGAES